MRGVVIVQMYQAFESLAFLSKHKMRKSHIDRNMLSEHMLRMTQSNLKQVRVAREMSQAALAHRLGVAQCQISRWENGKLDAERVPLLCEVLQCNGHDLRPDLFPPPDVPDRDVNADV